MAFAASALLSTVAAAAAAAATCTGYLVTGAGDESFNGCFVLQKEKYAGRETFALGSGQQLYTWEGGPWKLGCPGHNVSYAAISETPWPPESKGGCGVGWEVDEVGRVPCPSIKRSNLGPPPPLPPPPPPAPAPPPMRLVWEDHFDGGTLNTSLWNVLEQVHRGGVYTKANVRVQDGNLVMETIAQNLTIRQGVQDVRFFVTSGAVNTSGLFAQRFGRWEARVKLPTVWRSSGYTLHTSIWLIEDRDSPGVSGCPHEIDVVEQHTSAAGPVSSAVANLHPFNGTVTGPEGCQKVPYLRPSPGSTARGDWTTSWTNFTVDWTESWIAMHVNGEVYANFDTQAAAVAMFSDPLFLALTACVMDRVPPNAEDVLPQQYLVDYVKVFEWI